MEKIVKSELVVDVQPQEISIALLEDDRLMELSQETREMSYNVGNVYLGRIKKVLPSLNAVFVDVGYEKDAFLHYLDLGASFLRLNHDVQHYLTYHRPSDDKQTAFSQPEVGKEGQMGDFLKAGDHILVQISKEPINTKGPRLTAEVSLAGRNMVLIPYGDKVMVSNKIKSESERSRLRQLVSSIKPAGFGIIVRTVAEGKRVAELDTELKVLLKRWDDMVHKLQAMKEPSISLINEDFGRTIGLLRDIFNPSFEHIYVNDKEVFSDVESYVELIAPESKHIVRLYNGEQPIFDHFQVTRQMKTGMGRTVGFKNGGYLIVERTEALWSIDVNSGSKKQISEDQEENAFNYNLLAAEEIAHLLRLRDIGGIIIIDFIDMDSAEHQQALYERMRDLLALDRAKHNILKLSKFGLMQITRQRVRPAAEVSSQEVCPTCHGHGKIQSSLLFTDRLQEEIIAYTSEYGKHLRLYVHPFIFAFAKQGWLKSLRSRWRLKYGVKLLENQQFGVMQYAFTDRKGNRLLLSHNKEDKE